MAEPPQLPPIEPSVSPYAPTQYAQPAQQSPYGQPGQYGQQTNYGQPAQYGGQGGGWGQAAAQPYQLHLPPTDQKVDPAHVTIAWIVAVLTLGYMLPWAIAATRGKSNAAAVGLVNFFTGWFFGVGWIVALVMACGAHQQRYVAAPAMSSLPPAGWYPAPDGRGQAYWDGRQWTGHRA